MACFAAKSIFRWEAFLLQLKQKWLNICQNKYLYIYSIFMICYSKAIVSWLYKYLRTNWMKKTNMIQRGDTLFEHILEGRLREKYFLKINPQKANFPICSSTFNPDCSTFYFWLSDKNSIKYISDRDDHSDSNVLNTNYMFASTGYCWLS